MAAARSLSKDMKLSWEPVRMVTPHHMQSLSGFRVATLELSTLDMLYDYYNSVLLFYDGRRSVPAHDLDEPVKRLRHALEELLLHCPCAAGLLLQNETDGRLEVRYPASTSTAAASEHKLIVDGTSCTPLSMNAPDAAQSPSSMIYGVPFYVAHANISLSDLGDVAIPDPSLDILYPSKPTPGNDSKGRPVPRFVMAFQVTTFTCGGFTLAHTCSHAYADGHTGATILQNLCSIARGQTGLANPPQMSPTRREVIRARDPPSPTMQHKFIQTRHRSEPPPPKGHHLHYGTARRFAFTMDALEALRVRVAKPGEVPKKVCTRNQVLVALLWIAGARVRHRVQGLPGSDEMNLRIPMNLRTRGFPNLTKGYMGNALYLCSVAATLQELCESSVADVARKIKRTVESVDLGECMQSMVDYLELQLRDGMIPLLIGDDSRGMPSLVGLPFYDTDCGWGPPLYLARPSQQLSNRYIILDHPAARAWNVLVVFASPEEYACFQDSIAELMSSSLD